MVLLRTSSSALQILFNHLSGEKKIPQISNRPNTQLPIDLEEVIAQTVSLSPLRAARFLPPLPPSGDS